jgi:elongation factor G
MTVDKQMKRYNIPRLIFLNKCDRIGANPINCVNKIREKLRLNAFLTQLPIGLESEHKGVVDLIENAAFYFDGPSGETIRKEAVPLEMQAQVKEKFDELIQGLADIDEEIGDLYIMEETPTKEQIKNAIRRQTIALKFVPVFCGSAFKNVGVQLLLDAVVEYMPAPHEVKNYALDLKREESSVEISSSAKEPLLLFAFKLEDGKFGQLTYCRIYQGRLTKGSSIFNSRTRTKERTPRIVRMHSNEMEDVDSLDAGEIGALFGLDCVTGDTFTDGKLDFAMVIEFFNPNFQAHSLIFCRALYLCLIR